MKLRIFNSGRIILVHLVNDDGTVTDYACFHGKNIADVDEKGKPQERDISLEVDRVD